MNKIVEEHVKFMNKVFEQTMKVFEEAMKRGDGIYDGYFLSVRIENGKPYVKYYRFSSKSFGEELKEEARAIAQS